MRQKIKVIRSVADPGCLSRILDPEFTHPGSRIPDPKTATKERGEKNLLSYFFYSHKFHKIESYFIFEMLKKNRKKPIREPDPGVKKAPDPGSGSATLVKRQKNK